MARCTGITQAGTACKGIPIDGSSYCYVHHPDHTEERRRHGSRGGKRGGRGRPSAELVRLQGKFEELVNQVLNGTVERADGAVAGQLLNGARACVRDGLAAREQEELLGRLEQVEEALQSRKDGNPMGRLNERLRKVEREAGGLYQTLTLEDGTKVKYESEDMLDAVFAVLEGEDHPFLSSVWRMDPNKGIPSLVRALAGEGDLETTEEPDGN